MEYYAADKPEDCRYCYFGTRKGECTRHSECYYVIKRNNQTRKTCAKDCPYGAHWPCIGWCTRKILEKKRNDENVRV